MNQSELIEKVAETADLEKAEAGRVVDSVLEAISAALKGQEKVSLQGLGIFDITDRKARQGRNPATGEVIQIAATKSIKFRPSKSLKDAVSPSTRSTPKAAAKTSEKKPPAAKKPVAKK